MAVTIWPERVTDLQIKVAEAHWSDEPDREEHRLRMIPILREQLGVGVLHAMRVYLVTRDARERRGIPPR